ncbi:MAG: hypothetical protein JO021_17895 [Alphaproteobacteria bacterium]|nr:hypothetical protein [Alphaproteobacteria bacterium]
MYLLEHEAKTLLADAGLPVPPGVLAEQPAPFPPDLPGHAGARVFGALDEMVEGVVGALA